MANFYQILFVVKKKNRNDAFPCADDQATTVFFFLFQLSPDLHQSLRTNGVMSVQEFVSRAVRHHKPPTPSASTPYRQLKRHLSQQVAADQMELFLVVLNFLAHF